MIEADNSVFNELVRFQITDTGSEIEFNLIEHFRIYCKIKYADSTIRSYMDKVEEFDSIIAKSGLAKGVCDFDKTWDYQKFRQILFYYVFKLQESGIKPQTILKKINAIKRFFIFLKDRDFVSINPIDDFRDANLSFYKIISEERQAVPLEKLEEIISVGSVEVKHWKNPEIDAVKTHLLRTCYLVLAKDLLRSQEFCSLNVGNFFLDDKYFVTGDFAKVSGKRRPLDDQTIWHIRVLWWLREN